jgi:DNA invertase Pin-like site-specific DNA recombinase
MLIGYARVSTQDQTLNLQKDALEKLGCNKIFTDTASGAKAERTGLNEALEYVREGDTLVVWRLDRLGRSLKHLIETISGVSHLIYVVVAGCVGERWTVQPRYFTA